MRLGYISKDRLPADRAIPDVPVKSDWEAVDSMTDRDVEAAAKADPDCPPLAEDVLARLRRRPRTIRRA